MIAFTARTMAPLARALSSLSLIFLANALPAVAPGDAPTPVIADKRATTPTDIPQASALVSSAYAAFPSDPIGFANALILNSLVDGADLAAFLEVNLSENNSQDNINPINPTPAIYPQAGPSDPAYVQTEATLRSAIHVSPAIAYEFLYDLYLTSLRFPRILPTAMYLP